ncbi:dTDP-4-dehydrorhamnose reductase [Massilia agri]|uniref:dTDP-4-dehydrorhamnose reductase n=1 Tax=Massilia agri TaxID=1886785 RepID=A0ABT2AFW5_9BURK|nr:dTDP-4-dehydrorhamnose reductase [Massilia agri]MCS0595129.1 dTDP-4-dehydrorhamnose reductase [Massilia agri]
MKILLLGKDGQVGWELQRALAPLGELHALGRMDLGLCDTDGLRARVRAIAPDVIVNAAAWTAVDRAESEEAAAQAVNARAPTVLAEEAARMNAWLVHYSTDYVFDGRKDGAYNEQDAVNPLSAYGRSKAAGEEGIRASGVRHLILRTGWVFGRGQNFAHTILSLARERERIKVVADQFGAPTAAELLADVTALALYRIAAMGAGADALSGTYHVAAGGRTSWHAYARHLVAEATAAGAPLRATPEGILPIATADWPTPAARPANGALDCSKFRAAFGLVLPDWRHHLNRFVATLVADSKVSRS